MNNFTSVRPDSCLPLDCEELVYVYWPVTKWRNTSLHLVLKADNGSSSVYSFGNGFLTGAFSSLLGVVLLISSVYAVMMFCLCLAKARNEAYEMAREEERIFGNGQSA